MRRAEWDAEGWREEDGSRRGRMGVVEGRVVRRVKRVGTVDAEGEGSRVAKVGAQEGYRAEKSLMRCFDVVDSGNPVMNS